MNQNPNDPEECRFFENDQAIIEALRAGGDVAIFARKCLYKRCIRMVFFHLQKQRYFRKQDEPNQLDEANDVWAEVFLSLSVQVSKPDWALTKTNQLSTYLYACIRNEVWKRGKQAGKPLPPPGSPGPESQTSADILEVIEIMGEPCRTILSLDFMGYKSHEIADILNQGKPEDEHVSDAWVRKKKQECLERLRNLLDNPKF